MLSSATDVARVAKDYAIECGFRVLSAEAKDSVIVAITRIKRPDPSMVAYAVFNGDEIKSNVIDKFFVMMRVDKAINKWVEANKS